LEAYNCEKLRLHALVFEEYSPLEVLESDDIHSLMIQLLEALAYCHSKRIIYRDVKRSNILCKRQGDMCVLVLCDFNLAVRCLELCDSGPVGTLEYMAPEMFRPIGYNFAVDVWSAGIVVYEWIFGKHPFFVSGGTTEDYIEQLQNFCKDIKNNLHLPQGNQFTVLQSMLEPNPLLRLQAPKALKMLCA